MPKKKQSAKKQARSTNRASRQTLKQSIVATPPSPAPVRSAQKSKVSPLAAALILVAIGIIGLMFTMNNRTDETAQTGGQSLQVRDSSSTGTQQSDTGVSSNLQNPARANLQDPAKTKDLLQGKVGDDVQQGTNADKLR